MLLNFNQVNINSELELLELDYNERKLFVLTNKARDEKELNGQLFLIANLSKLSNKFSNEEILTRMMQRIGYLSPINFLFILVPKGNVEKQKQEFLPSLIKKSASDLAEISEKKNKEYFFACCHLCQKSFRELKWRGNKEVIHDTSSFCPNFNCINSFFVENKQECL